MTALPSNLEEGFAVPAAPAKWVLGTFDRRLTIYDQQIRALNLAYRLYKSSTVPDNEPLLVIGAGIAGITFAAGWIWLGRRVVLVEKQPVPCHLQRGCDIRWIHPHIYHWPKPGAEQPYAGLPLLSWIEGTASEVSRQITVEWERLSKAAVSLGLLEEVYNSTYNFVSPDGKKVEVNGLKDGQQWQQTLKIAGVVYAVGFGAEENSLPIIAHSYWENDSFNQLPPNHPQGTKIQWLITGMGDGGAIDLQRLCIEAFRQERVVQELFDGQKELVDSLRTVEDDRGGTNAYLREKFEALARLKKFSDVDDRLRRRRRSDATVTLNSRSADFITAFDASRASFLNKLILHRLYAITLVSGKIT